MSTEKIKFVAHDGLVNLMIHKQHGEAYKSILELIQNSIDAGTERVIIDFTATGFSVEDTGSGFPSKKYIQDYFASFGTPHQDGDSTFGRFRIGRGQIMSLANTTWHSNVWKMNVNISSSDAVPEFTLTTLPDEEKREGCIVTGEWHTEINPFEFEKQRKKLLRSIKYLECPIFNKKGNRLNSDPKNQFWDMEDDLFYFKKAKKDTLKKGLSVYNLGIFVGELDGYETGGISGTLVTKEHLSLNTARNKILVTSVVFENIMKKISDELFGVSHSNINALSASEKDGLFHSWLYGERSTLPIFNAAIIRDGKNKFLSFWSIIGKKGICVVPYMYRGNNVILDKVYTENRGHIFFISQNTLTNLDCQDWKDFLKKIKNAAEYYLTLSDLSQNRTLSLQNIIFYTERVKEYSFTKLASKIKQVEDEVITDITKVGTRKMQLVLLAFQKAFNYQKFQKSAFSAMISENDNLAHLGRRYQHDFLLFCHHRREGELGGFEQIFSEKDLEESKGAAESLSRKLYFGKTSSANVLAWTDGSNYIALSKALIKEHESCFAGFHRIATVIAHEMCHQSSNIKTHSHDLEFYEAFHNLTMGTKEKNSPTYILAEKAYQNWLDMMVKEKIKISDKYFKSISYTPKGVATKEQLKLDVGGTEINISRDKGENNYKLVVRSQKDLKAILEYYPEISIKSISQLQEKMGQKLQRFFIEKEADHLYFLNQIGSSLSGADNNTVVALHFKWTIELITTLAKGNKKIEQEAMEIMLNEVNQSCISRLLADLTTTLTKINNEEPNITLISLGRAGMNVWANSSPEKERG